MSAQDSPLDAGVFGARSGRQKPSTRRLWKIDHLADAQDGPGESPTRLRQVR